MLAVEHGIGELRYPVAEYHHPGLLGELQVELYVAVAVEKVVDIAVGLYVSLCEEHQVLTVFAHVGRFATIHALKPAVLCPQHSEGHAPARMQGREEHLAETVVEHGPEQLELAVGVAQTVETIM